MGLRNWIRGAAIDRTEGFWRAGGWDTPEEAAVEFLRLSSEVDQLLTTDWPVAFGSGDPTTMNVAVRRGMPTLKAMTEFLEAQQVPLTRAIDAQVYLHYKWAVEWYIEAGAFLLAGDMESFQFQSQIALSEYGVALDRQGAVNSGQAK
jgi:hypothetical protein